MTRLFEVILFSFNTLRICFSSPNKFIIKSFLNLFFDKNNPTPLTDFDGELSPPIASIAIVIFFFISNN